MTDLLLHTCCGPCSTVAVPAWRERGVEPVGWFENPNIQPAAELARRRESMRRFSRAAGLELVDSHGEGAAGWTAWRESLATAAPGSRCAECLGLRLGAAGEAARALGFSRFSTTLTVSPYQRHDLIVAAGEAAADAHGVDFVYLDARDRFRDSYAESRRLELYRQPYCGCAASKWEAWHERRARRRMA
jgi:predicted adenine nucleotide alpha hydrolase (AANH) superfamily ATPase